MIKKEYQFKGENVYIKKIVEAVMLFPVDKEWEIFMHGLNSFSPDFMSEGRQQEDEQSQRLENPISLFPHTELAAAQSSRRMIRQF